MVTKTNNGPPNRALISAKIAKNHCCRSHRSYPISRIPNQGHHQELRGRWQHGAGPAAPAWLAPSDTSGTGDGKSVSVEHAAGFSFLCNCINQAASLISVPPVHVPGTKLLLMSAISPRRKGGGSPPACGASCTGRGAELSRAQPEPGVVVLIQPNDMCTLLGLQDTPCPQPCSWGAPGAPWCRCRAGHGGVSVTGHAVPAADAM